MRQLPNDVTLVDDEGFPKAVVTDGRDKESGELLTTKIQYIRKRPKLRLSPEIDSLLSADVLHFGEGRRFRGFRIQQFTRGSAWKEPWYGNTRLRNLEPQLQTCVHLKGGSPVHYTRKPLYPHNPSRDVVRRAEYAVRPSFRVPKASLHQTAPEQPYRNPNTVCVNIWEEFLFGKSVISPRYDQTRQGSEETNREEAQEEEDEGPVNYIRRVLGYFLPKFLIDIIVYTAFFLIFFASCVGYNNFCELGCYILLAQHLKIHEKAYEKKVDVVFTGSIFQGPLYALTRNWCEHCSERERGQVIRNLMRKMKADILPSLDTAESSPQDSTKDPP